jgi:hypothetical protein
MTLGRAIQRQNWECQERDLAEMKLSVSQMRISTSLTILPANENVTGYQENEEANYKETATTGCEMLLYQSHVLGSIRQKRNRVVAQDGIKSFLGMVALVITNREDVTQTHISFNLPAWLYARRYEIFLRKSYQGWDQSFRSYKVISYDAAVLHYSMSGDVAGLQKLFETGDASPFEMDPEGRTPLHVGIRAEFKIKLLMSG